jgi:hypothetical protein
MSKNNRRSRAMNSDRVRRNDGDSAIMRYFEREEERRLKIKESHAKRRVVSLPKLKCLEDTDEATKPR